MAEEVGFEPTGGLHRQTISSRSRYDHFDTPPYLIMLRRKTSFDQSVRNDFLKRKNSKTLIIKALELSRFIVISGKITLKSQSILLPKPLQRRQPGGSKVYSPRHSSPTPWLCLSNPRIHTQFALSVTVQWLRRTSDKALR